MKNISGISPVKPIRGKPGLNKTGYWHGTPKYSGPWSGDFPVEPVCVISSGTPFCLEMRLLWRTETGYSFSPAKYDYSFDAYFQSFSPKSRKSWERNFRDFTKLGASFHDDRIQDMDLMFQMNLDSYGETSFFSNSMFLGSFEKLLLWLHSRGLLRITTVMCNGEVAAVDVGSVWNSSYTVLAGGVNPNFPGVAKLINFHHMEWACRNRMKTVDFLCGDYGWRSDFIEPPSSHKIEAPSYPAVYVRKK